MQTFEVVRQVTFEAVAQEVSGSEPSSVMSADGSRLFFTNGHQVWAYDIIAKTVSAPYLAETAPVQGALVQGAPIKGLAVSGDGARLVVAWAGQPLQMFDAASGAALAFPGGIVAERP